MLRCASALALFVAVSFHFSSPALAQSSGDDAQLPGYWYRGEWNGFLPGKNTLRARPDCRTKADGAVVPVAYEEPLGAEIDEQMLGEEVLLPIASCGDDCGSIVSEACCGTPSTWVRAEYLGWWTEGMNVPALVTTSPAASGGVLGQAGTSILFGDGSLNTDARSGGRFTFGMWFDDCQFRGVEAIYMGLGEKAETFAASNADFAVLARPFLNVRTNQQDARLIALAGTVSGNVSVTADTQFQGAEILFRREATRAPGSRLDYLLGYRWTNLKDNLRIDESTLSLAGATNGVTFDLFDQFNTRNNFHGAEFGLKFDRQVNCLWSLELLGKIAVGNSHMVADVSGQTLTTAVDNSTSLTSGGLLAQRTNIGTYEHDVFSTVTELGLTLRRQFDCGLEATFGYTLVHWSEVARGGDQIDFGVNTSQLGGGARVGEGRPGFLLDMSDFWAQGLSLGLEYRF